MRPLFVAASIAVSLFLSSTSFGMGAEDVVKKSQAAFLYPGKDFKARVMMKLINKDGQERIRELTMLRKNYSESGGEQKYFMYFHQPADVRDMTFLVWKYPRKDSDRWLFIPAIKLVKRIAANDKRSSFVGSDFSYEDVSGRAVDEDNHSLLREEKYEGRDVQVVKSAPKAPESVDFGYKLSWIDKESFIPWKEEYYDKRGSLSKVFTANEVKSIEGYITVVKRTMRNVQSGHRTEVIFNDVKYNQGLSDSLFTERSLKNPPREIAR